ALARPHRTTHRGTVSRPLPTGRRAVAVVLAADPRRFRARSDYPRSERRAVFRPRRERPRIRHARTRFSRGGTVRAGLRRLGARAFREGPRALAPRPGRPARMRDGIERVHVHTCSLDHPAALSAYRRAGFT